MDQPLDLKRVTELAILGVGAALSALREAEAAAFGAAMSKEAEAAIFSVGFSLIMFACGDRRDLARAEFEGALARFTEVIEVRLDLKTGVILKKL